MIVCLLFSSSRSLLNVSCIFSILFPRLWIIFTIIILNSFSGSLPISSSFVMSGGCLPCSFICCVFLCLLICLTYCVWGLLFPGCRFIVPIVFGVCPQWRRLVQWVVLASWWMRLDLVFLMGRSTSDVVFWGVCHLIMTLGSLSANGWCCVSVLLVVWHRVSSTVACWSLSVTGSWHWDGDLWEIFAVRYYVELGGLWWTNFLNLALPPQRHSPDTWLEHQEPVIHTAQNKREKKRKKEKKDK